MNLSERIARMKKAGAQIFNGSGWWMPWKDDSLKDHINDDGAISMNIPEEVRQEKLIKAIEVRSIEIRPSEKRNFEDTYLIVGKDLEKDEDIKIPVNGNIKGLLTRLFMNLPKSELEGPSPEVQDEFNKIYNKFNTAGATFDDVCSVEDRQVVLIYCGKLENDGKHYHTWTGFRLDDDSIELEEEAPF